MGIKELTQIQAMTYDPIVQGKNVLARARTGTGKTIAFVLPIGEFFLQSLKIIHSLRFYYTKFTNQNNNKSTD
jgi:superfamily II DNA/RNA helicase